MKPEDLAAIRERLNHINAMAELVERGIDGAVLEIVAMGARELLKRYREDVAALLNELEGRKDG